MRILVPIVSLITMMVSFTAEAKTVKHPSPQYAESYGTVEGIFETICEVKKLGAGEPVFMHFIKQDNGERIQVTFPANMQLPEPGARVRLKNSFQIKTGKDIRAISTGDNLELLAVSASKYDGLGQKNVLVGLVNFPDLPNANKATKASYSTIYQQLKTGFISQSFGNIDINANILENVALPMTSVEACTGIGLYNMMTEFEKVAKARGIDVAPYQHYQIILPPMPSGCGWCGLGSVGGRYTWINACNNYGTVGHELGHNIGLYHSNSMSNCSPNDWKTGCQNNEYMDGASLQGIAQGEFTAVHKEKLHWLDYSETNPKTQQVTASGLYFIEPLETKSANVKALRFERAPGEFYYVEFRQPVNYDVSISKSYHNALGIHLWMSNSTASWRLKNVGVNDSFVDPSFPGGGLKISLVSYSASGAQVKVEIGSIPPPTVVPTVSPTIVPTVVPPTVVPTKTPTVTPTVSPTVSPTVTPTIPPGAVVFNVVPGMPSYKYDPARTIWSSVSIWIKSDGKPAAGVATNYKVTNSANKSMYALTKNTDGNGFVKMGLPIDKNFVPGTYKINVSAIVGGKTVVAPATYFEVK